MLYENRLSKLHFWAIFHESPLKNVEYLNLGQETQTQTFDLQVWLCTWAKMAHLNASCTYRLSELNIWARDGRTDGRMANIWSLPVWTPVETKRWWIYREFTGLHGWKARKSYFARDAKWTFSNARLGLMGVTFFPLRLTRKETGTCFSCKNVQMTLTL